MSSKGVAFDIHFDAMRFPVYPEVAYGWLSIWLVHAGIFSL